MAAKRRLPRSKKTFARAASPVAPFRRLRLSLLGFLGLVGGFLLAGPSTASQPAPRFPNVLFVTIDTLRADRLSGYGYDRPTSPSLDRLMGDGARFENARCVEPLTAPSMASMLTSLYPHEHGSSRNGLAVRPDLPSLPRVLERRGFRTAAFISNWTLKDELLQMGDHFEDFHEVFTRKRWLGLLKSEANADDVTAEALEWLQEHAKNEPRRPFFAWVHYVEPHAPYRLHEEFRPSLGLGSGGDLSKSDRYDTEVAFVDRSVGRLLKELGRLYPAEQILVAFSADHGENLGEHGYWGHGRHLWEENLSIPMSITWPGRVVPGTVAGLASNLDLAPTVLGLMGLPYPSAFRGFDWTSVLTGEADPPEERTTFHQAHKGAVMPGQDRQQVRRKGLLEVAIVSGGRKETLRLKGGEDLSLYDLAEDPGEKHSLAREAQQPSEALEAWLDEVREGLEAADSLPPPSLDDESIEQLRSLGYLD